METTLRPDMNRITKEVVLHIGLPKTGSTSIQETLFRQKSKRYYYPKSWGPNHGQNLTHLLKGNYHRNTTDLIFSKDHLNFRDEKNLKKLRTELSAHCFNKLVFSSEEFYLFSELDLIQLKMDLQSLFSEKTNITVVAYVRNPIDLLTSAFQQITKMRPYFKFQSMENITPYAYLNLNDLSDFLSAPDLYFEKFIRVFGRENIKLFKFEDTLLHPYGPVGFFCQTILDVTLEEIRKMNIQKRNESISQLAMDIFINIHQQQEQERNDISMSYMHKQSDFFLLAKGLSGPKYQLTDLIKIQHLEKIGEQLHYLNKTFQIDYLDCKVQKNNPTESNSLKAPTKNNLEELTKLFPKLSAYTQQCIINYLQTLSNTRSDELPNYIQKLIDQHHSPSQKISHLISYYLVFLQYLLFKVRCNLIFNMIWTFFSLKNFCTNTLFKKLHKAR